MVLSESTYYETLIKLFIDILEVNFPRVAGQTFMLLQQHSVSYVYSSRNAFCLRNKMFTMF